MRCCSLFPKRPCFLCRTRKSWGRQRIGFDAGPTIQLRPHASRITKASSCSTRVLHAPDFSRHGWIDKVANYGSQRDWSTRGSSNRPLLEKLRADKEILPYPCHRATIILVSMRRFEAQSKSAIGSFGLRRQGIIVICCLVTYALCSLLHALRIRCCAEHKLRRRTCSNHLVPLIPCVPRMLYWSRRRQR